MMLLAGARIHRLLGNSASLGPGLPYPALLLDLIHPSAWNRNSANFAIKEFSEVCRDAQPSSICSSVLTFQCAGGLRSGGSWVSLSPSFVSSNCFWVRKAAPERSAPERSAAGKSAPESFVTQRIAPERSAPARFAPARFAPARNAPERFAQERSASGRCAPERSASERSAQERSAPERFALKNSAPERFVLRRSTPSSSASESFTSERSGTTSMALPPFQEFQTSTLCRRISRCDWSAI